MNKQHSQEIASWAMSYQFDDPDSYAWALKEYGAVEGQQVAAEIAYIQYFNVVPEWATCIESFEVVDGNYIYVHRDPDETQ